MARADWKAYYTPIFDKPWHGSLEYFRFRSNARRHGEYIEALNFGAVKMIGVAAVKGKKPQVQRWFARNYRDRWDRVERNGR
jgi:hypothetical protein